MPTKKEVGRVSWVIPTPDLAVTVAIKALSNGTADEEQQKRALRWILMTCSAGGWAYRPEGDRETCVALGMQRIGEAIKHEINISLNKLRNSENG